MMNLLKPLFKELLDRGQARVDGASARLQAPMQSRDLSQLRAGLSGENTPGARWKPTGKPVLGLATLAMLALSGCDESPKTSEADLVGQVSYVFDGDTIAVSRVPVRLSGLTCDERETPLGDSATAYMRDLVAGQSVRCALSGEVTYNRRVGRCELADGSDLGAAMISAGQCGRCARYDRDGAYRKVQAAAGAFGGSIPGYCRT